MLDITNKLNLDLLNSTNYPYLEDVELYYVYYARIIFNKRRYINRELITYPPVVGYKIGITSSVSKRAASLKYFAPWRWNPNIKMLGCAVVGCQELAYLLEQDILDRYKKDRYKGKCKYLGNGGSYELFYRDVLELDFDKLNIDKLK